MAGRVRVVKAVLGRRKFKPDPAFEAGMARLLAAEFGRDYLLELYQRHVLGEDKFAQMMRRVIVKAVARRCGDGLIVGSQVGFKHLETFEIGNTCFIGAGAYIQGRFDGRCVIGNNVWIGPGAYFDARDLVLGDYVGWGPGAKVLGSAHTGLPADVPIVQTDLEIRPVRVRALGGHRHERRPPPGRHGRQGRRSSERGRWSPTTSPRSPSSLACRPGSCGGARGDQPRVCARGASPLPTPRAESEPPRLGPCPRVRAGA